MTLLPFLASPHLSNISQMLHFHFPWADCVRPASPPWSLLLWIQGRRREEVLLWGWHGSLSCLLMQLVPLVLYKFNSEYSSSTCSELLLSINWIYDLSAKTEPRTWVPGVWSLDAHGQLFCLYYTVKKHQGLFQTVQYFLLQIVLLYHNTVSCKVIYTVFSHC